MYDTYVILTSSNYFKVDNNYLTLEVNKVEIRVIREQDNVSGIDSYPIEVAY